jgi:hypothetical protein
MALTTLPLRRQRVQTLMRFVDPSTTARTLWMLGLNERLVLLLAWLTLLPVWCFLKQISHAKATGALLR